MTDHQSGTAHIPLPENYSDMEGAWHKAVAKVFARVQKKDIADIPLDIWKKLIHSTYNNVDVKPLYTRADEVHEAAAPGHFPFTRGDVSVTERGGWGVTESFGPEDNKQLLHALNVGTTNVVVEGTDVAATLQGVILDLVPLRLNSGSQLPEAVKALYALIDEAGDDVASKVIVDLGAAPLTAPFDKSDTVDLATAIELAVEASNRPGTVRAILVDTVPLSNQGASDIQEIAYGVAAGVEYLRALTDAGLSVDEAFAQISFRVAITDDQFAQIAKLRALRTVWARVAEVSGATTEHASAVVHAVTAPVMFAQRDPWVNMLRSTVAAFAAGVGGAQDVEVLVFDYAVPGGMPNTSRPFARRIARNTNLLLLEESHLGHVVDPAGGSFYVESLTEQIAHNAWAIFTDVEKAGGLRAAEDAVREALDEEAKRVYTDIAYRRKKVTGINEFPNLNEAPLPAECHGALPNVRRWAAEFEALRDRSDVFLEKTGGRPSVGLIPLGPLAKHNIRTGFTTNLLATGGILALNPGQVTPGTEEFETAATAADIVILCGTDSEYAENGEDAVKTLREAGAKEILLAGSPRSFESKTHCPDGYVNLQINAAATLAELLDKLGA